MYIYVINCDCTTKVISRWEEKVDDKYIPFYPFHSIPSISSETDFEVTMAKCCAEEHSIVTRHDQNGRSRQPCSTDQRHVTDEVLFNGQYSLSPFSGDSVTSSLLIKPPVRLPSSSPSTTQNYTAVASFDRIHCWGLQWVVEAATAADMINRNRRSRSEKDQWVRQ